MSETPRARGGRGAREAVLAAATDLFLRHGFRATGTDQIAAAASVSKQTVYNQFHDKENLFRCVVGEVSARAQGFSATLTSAFAPLQDVRDLEHALRDLARRYLATVADPRVLAVRRLLVSEAARFPDLAREYHAVAPGGVVAALAEQFAALAARGLIQVDDPVAVAQDFAFLLLGPLLDHAMFHVDAAVPAAGELDARADRATRVFLAAVTSGRLG